jgi:NAD+ synthase (glutamine-hydrolysing)
MNQRFGLVRVSCVAPRLALARPAANAARAIACLDAVPDSDIALFPELSLTGYTCADLFGQTVLLDSAREALLDVARATAGRPQLVVVGLPLLVGASLFNVAAVLHDGRVIGVVPKQFLPTYKEFYEARWFHPADGGEPTAIDLGGGGDRVPFGIDLLFEGPEGVTVGVEICEDLWVPSPPSASQAMAGATILLNPSASNDTIGKAGYRRALVTGQSGRCVSCYAYAGAGPGESTTDLVFGGHLMIAENGSMLAESRQVGGAGPLELDGDRILTADVDVERLRTDRVVLTSFAAVPGPGRTFRQIPFRLATAMGGLRRAVPGHPFVPDDSPERASRCAEIFAIQCAGLARRVGTLPASMTLNIGVSGGLDSTLALLVAVKTCDLLGRDRKSVRGLTMPGFGTTGRTLTNALALMDHLGIASETIDIAELSLRTFIDLGHKPFGIDPAGLDVAAFKARLGAVAREHRHDLVFENVQARLRTFLLMSRGFVVGTGDLSELALGWCTYNGDHMSMYNVNASIPKTLVQFLVRHAAEHEFGPGPVRDTLLSIAATTISPELLPASSSGEIEQSTEDTLGPYELHDFFLYHVVRGGASPSKVRFLAEHAAFSRPYPGEIIDRTLETFVRRFFANQFKRSCVPDGPKVGSVSLSPRGDWRMPSDARPETWLDDLDAGAAGPA